MNEKHPCCVLKTDAHTASFLTAPGAMERPLTWDLSHSALSSATPFALWKSPLMTTKREIIREKTELGGRGSGSGFKGWITSLTRWSLSITIHICSRQRKDWRLFLSNLLIKSRQSCLKTEWTLHGTGCPGKEISLHQIYGAGSKTKLKPLHESPWQNDSSS